MSKTIEVEGGEIAIQNSHGDIAIIPIKDVDKVKEKIDTDCHDCLDEYVSSLPKMKDYAEDGSLIPSPDPIPEPVPIEPTRPKKATMQ